MMMLVNVYLNVGEQLRCVLHLIDQHRRLVKLQKQGGIIFRHVSLCEIVQCHISAADILFFCQFPQHSRFARLPWSCQ